MIWHFWSCWNQKFKDCVGLCFIWPNQHNDSLYLRSEGAKGSYNCKSIEFFYNSTFSAKSWQNLGSIDTQWSQLPELVTPSAINYGLINQVKWNTHFSWHRTLSKWRPPQRVSNDLFVKGILGSNLMVQSNLSYLGLSMNSLKRKILHNFRCFFSKEFNFFLS